MPGRPGVRSLVVGTSGRDHVFMSTRLTVLVYAVFAFALVLAGVAIGGALLLELDQDTSWSRYLVTNTAIGLSAAPCGLLIARARPGNPIGWLFLVAAVAHLLTAAMVPLSIYGADNFWPAPSMRLLVTIYLFSWSWGVFCCFPLILQLFPTGAPVGPQWRVLCWLTVGNAALGNLFVGPTPDLGASSFLVVPWWQVTEGVGSVASPLIMLASIASLIVRYVRGAEAVRQQLLWLLVAVLLIVVLNAPSWASIPTGGAIPLLLSFPLIPVAVTIAVLRHGLYDVRLVVSRLLAFVLLTAAVVASYVGLVALLDHLLHSAGAPVLATLAVALAFNPVRLRLQRAVDRAVYGARNDPVAAVSAVGRRLAGDDLDGVAHALREALRLSYVAVRQPCGDTVASGEPAAETQTRTLTYHDRQVGDLLVAPRRGERRVAAADQVVLDLVATPLAIALHAQSLADDLEASRGRVIEAASQERERLRRELHDSLGPVLTGAALKADGIALAAGRRPEMAESLAIELADQLRDSIVAIRRLAYGLRPSCLDELGLVGALREEGSRLGPVAVTIDAPESLPELPPAVEVAAYRIAAEALTNVARHSDATHASVRLSTDSAALEVTIADDGRPTGPWSPGVGIASIRTRASEVGGACTAGPTTDGGRVVAHLPLRAAP